MAQQSSRFVAQKQHPALPGQGLLMPLLCKLRLPPEAVHVNVTVLMLWGNGPYEPLIADLEQRQAGGGHESRLGCLCIV
jgi:hypothetical protein